MEASSAPLGGPFGPPGALRGPLGTDCGPLDGPWSPLIPGPVPGRTWSLLEGPWVALGSSWASLGPPRGALGGSWAAPGALLAPPEWLLEPSGRLQSRVLPKSRISSTVQRFSCFFGGPGGLLAPPGALLEPSWRPLKPSWRLLGRPAWSWVALGWLWAGLSGSRGVFGVALAWSLGPGRVAARTEGLRRIYCID